MAGSRFLEFRVQAMDCMEEVATLRKVVGPLVSDEDALSFDIFRRRLRIDTTRQPVDPAAIVAAIRTAGMDAVPWSDSAGAAKDSHGNRNLLWTALSGAGLGLALPLGLLARWTSWLPGWGAPLETVLLLASTVCGMVLVLPKALRSAHRLQPDMNLLMTVAIAGAILLGEFEEAAAVAFLFALSETLEAWSVRRAHRAISALLDLSPPTARRLNEDRTEAILPIEQVPIGARILVRPGERIPLDGEVIEGTSEVNQAPITGESMPVSKEIGSTVFAGTINGNGILEIATTAAAGNSTMARIVRMVEDAQARRSPSEQWVDRFARYYTPTVMVCALLLCFLPPLWLGQGWTEWFYRSLVLLVIACPCALVISTPVAMVSALAAAARQGVLVKGGTHLETPARLQAIAFDKTGTLTAGEPTVQSILPWNGHTEVELLRRVLALESHSNHPLARAIVRCAAELGIEVVPADEYHELPGKGAVGRWNGETYWLGSVRLLRERQQQTLEVERQIARLADLGHTVILVGNDRHVCGLVSLADTVRPDAKESLEALRALGVRHQVLLTGDTASTALAIGQELRIDQVKAELLPGEKVEAVRGLVQEFGSVAMLGDGVNDAPALASATLGIAMGVAGSDAAIEVADVALMSDDLTKLPWLVAHSRRTLWVIRQNIWFSLGVKGLFAFLTMLGHASLWGAIAADTGATLLVILNGLRLLNEPSRRGSTIPRGA